jgi:hypothetical protein
VFTSFKHCALAFSAMSFACQSHATDTWTGLKDIQSLEVVETGGFLIAFTTALATPCAGSGPNTVYVYPDQNSVTASGVKTQYATALAAIAMGKQVNVMYDSASANCWGRYLIIQR